MKKEVAFILACAMAAVMVTVMAACNQITSGEVYDKEYTPGHYETYITTEGMWIGGKYISVPVAKVEYVPDKYVVYIRKENDKGEFDKANYTVSKERYDAVKIGDEVSFE